MAGQMLPINDRMRINWTSMMEQYFIDLMLDQLHRGNRMGHTFNKQAWTDMLTMFNSRFGTKYDRDTLKSHYSNLWKQYNDVKNLLEQSGFSWDDNRKMVLASDDAWVSIIKANPDAQYYWRKFLVNFNDLCLIFAYTAADGRYSRSSHDIDLDDDIQGLNFDAGMGGFPSESTNCVKAKWTSAMDRFFLELMLVQVKKGSKSNNTFSKEAWKDMLTLFNAKFCSQYGKNVLKRRYKKLFKYYCEMRSLLERKAHPDMHSYRKKTLLNYQDLSLVYGNELISGHQGCIHQDENFEDVTLQVKTDRNKGHHHSVQSDVGPCWKSSMDRYFIDLLQNQALIGNKIGHELTTEAWVELTRLFKAKFGSQYDDSILKNQFNHLRARYNDIKFLLEQSGFSWDETRDMVTAEDCVWDSYTKVYPHVRSYRNKSVASYYKLCVIYGEESSSGRYSDMAQQADIDIKPPVLMVEDQCLANGDCSKPDWTPSMDRYFIDLMLDQVHRGNKSSYTLDDQAWIDMAVMLNERFGSQHEKDILRQRHESLGKLFNGMKILLGQKGFSWNETQQLVKAYDDVWEAYTKEHPNARSYISTPKPDYNDLYLIYGNSISDEGHNQSGQGARNCNRGCWNADWTPPMDQLFIDLMLEHVRQGSMVDQRFNKQAWSDMVSKFSAAFGSQHDQYVLERRFMNLRKLFGDMKNLLDQSGFAWDDRRHMIIAGDSLWNAYLKDYPDAHPYRNRALPNYDDLFLIYGDENNHESNHHRSVVGNGHVLGSNVDDEDGLSPIDSNHPWINWTKPMEIYFIKLMSEQVLEGNKNHETFNEQAWAWIVAAFNEKFGLLCERDAVESWYLSLMKEYSNITNILNQNGFAWDETEQMVIADDDDWSAYIKEHPGAMKYKGRVLGSYNDLCVINGNSVAAGRASYLGVNTVIDNNAFDMEIDGVFGEAPYPTGKLEISDQRHKRKSLSSSTTMASRKVHRPKRGEAKEPVGLKPMGVMEEHNEERISIEEIVNALQVIPDMDDENFLEACKLLENEEKAKVFVAMDVKQRRKWLFRKLYR
ncbi:hypothetical protein NC651_029765 [Populus alba x Populus x berolinensis]|nr:hypothetical protein NC651_029765 [Populus alba x Populus x berolinensis]